MKGILFKPAMIRAIVEGRKTQTRRDAGLKEINKEPDKYTYSHMSLDYVIFQKATEYGSRMVIVKPRYHPGETVYIKEAWSSYKGKGDVVYKSDPGAEDTETFIFGGYHWSSPLFMPAWAARYHILIKNVRPERLQAITPDDCVKEGYPLGDIPEGRDEKQLQISREMRLGWYHALWDSINGAGSWDKNPFVFVYSFERVQESQ